MQGNMRLTDRENSLIADGMVRGDLYCLNCEYNLRMMHVEGKCPECGMGVRVTLREDLLKDSSPAWLMMLEKGARLFRAGVILALPMLWIGVVLGTIGFFCLMQKEEGREEPTRDRNLRLAGQGMLGLGAMGFIGILMGLVWLLVFKRTRVFEDRMYFDVLFLGLHAVYLLGLLLSWQYVKGLAMRMPSERLINGCKRMNWECIGAAGGILIVAMLANAGSIAYRFFGHYNWLYGPIMFAVICGILLWLWWRMFKFGGVMIEEVGKVRKYV